MIKENFKVVVPEFPDRKVIITEYGAVKNVFDDNTGRTNAKAINGAIEGISNQGGGTVVIPSGIWMSAPIKLLSGVRLYLERGAVLKFTKNMEDYPLVITNYEGQECIRAVSPVSAEGASDIAISGYGVIDGSGDLWRPVKQFKLTDRQWKALLEKSSYVIDTKEGGIWLPTESAYLGNKNNIQGNQQEVLKQAEDFYDFYRPVMVELKNCTNVLLENATFMNSPAWNIHPIFCKNLTVRNVKISNPYHAQNGDGIDVESCHNVEIYDSVFETGDDAICIKSGKNAEARTFVAPCENLYIHDCLVNDGHGGFVIGSEMSRGVKNILVENCTFTGTDVGVRIKSAMGRGGVVEDITVRGINMVNIKAEAVIMTMGYVLNSLDKNEKIQQVDESDVPYFKNINIENVACSGCETAIKLEPINGRPETISDITIKNSVFTAKKENVVSGENIRIENVDVCHALPG